MSADLHVCGQTSLVQDPRNPDCLIACFLSPKMIICVVSLTPSVIPIGLMRGDIVT